MTTQEIKKYLKKTDFRITPLEFFSIVNSSQDTIEKILLETNNAIYTIVTKNGNKINVEIIEEPPVKKMILTNKDIK